MYLIYRFNNRYSIKIIQVFALTSTYADSEIDGFYEDINTAIYAVSTYYILPIGDFCTKRGHKEDSAEIAMGCYAHGTRNEIGQMLDFIVQNNLWTL